MVLKYRYFLYSDLKSFFKNYSESRKCCCISSNTHNTTSRNREIVHSSIREYLDVDGIINCSFIIFNNFNHCINELISLFSRWFCSLNSVHTLKTKWTTILIKRYIGVIFFKPVQIIRYWTDTDYFMNGNICILEIITEIQNHGNEYINSRDSFVYFEVVRMCHGNLGLFKRNTLNLRNPICTVACKIII